MHKLFIPPPAVVTLLAIGLILPIAVCVVIAMAALLLGLGDASGAHQLGRVAVGGGILWAIDLICLLLSVAVNSLGEKDEPLE